ncbi:family 10 glycosylhydrolase [Oligoflexia bacterium]|nr:family 10 glycosylhydrolase [Oligoflexia bacterium]
MKEKALWVEAIGDPPAIESKELLEQAVLEARRLNFTDLYLQVARTGQAWFSSSFADASPWERAQKVGYDPLSLALEIGARAGLKIHAWINVFNLSTNAAAPVLKALGLGTLVSDNTGCRVDQYEEDGSPPGERGAVFQLDTPKLWLDPAQRGVFEYTTNLVSELISTYPALDGLHLDFFRYPYLLPIKPSSAIRVGYDFGYSAEALANFKGEVKIAEPLFQSDVQSDDALYLPSSTSAAIAWDTWRRDQLDRYLIALRGILHHQQALSVAVLPWADRAYLSSFQNWRRWLKRDLVDQVCLMSYTADMELFEQLVSQAVSFRSKKSKVVAGIGTYLLDDLEDIRKQAQIATASSADGIILFSYRNLKRRNQDYADVLSDLN